MTTLREAAQQALEYMKFIGKMDMHPEKWAIIGRLEAALAEPAQEPDDPARRCGGPGCDMTCCQPVREPVAGVVLNEEGRAALVEHGREEWHCVVRNARRLYATPPQRPAGPQGCDHCNHPLYAAIKCRVCGRVTEQAEPVHLTGLSIRAQSTIGRWLNEDMDRAVANGANSISMPDELVEIAAWLHAQAAPSSGRMGSGVRNDPR